MPELQSFLPKAAMYAATPVWVLQVRFLIGSP